MILWMFSQIYLALARVSGVGTSGGGVSGTGASRGKASRGKASRGPASLGAGVPKSKRLLGTVERAGFLQ